MPHQLIRDLVSRDMHKAIDEISEGIQSGLIVGAVFGLHLKGRRYLVNVAGTLARDPTLGRGVLAAVDDELQRMVQGQSDTDTTR